MNPDDRPGDLYPPADWFDDSTHPTMTSMPPAAPPSAPVPEVVVNHYHHFPPPSEPGLQPVDPPAQSSSQPQPAPVWRRVWGWVTPRRTMRVFAYAGIVYFVGATVGSTADGRTVQLAFGLWLMMLAFPFLLSVPFLLVNRITFTIVSNRLGTWVARLILICAGLVAIPLAFNVAWSTLVG